MLLTILITTFMIELHLGTGLAPPISYPPSSSFSSASLPVNIESSRVLFGNDNFRNDNYTCSLQMTTSADFYNIVNRGRFNKNNVVHSQGSSIDNHIKLLAYKEDRSCIDGAPTEHEYHIIFGKTPKKIQENITMEVQINTHNNRTYAGNLTLILGSTMNVTWRLKFHNLLNYYPVTIYYFSESKLDPVEGITKIVEYTFEHLQHKTLNSVKNWLNNFAKPKSTQHSTSTSFNVKVGQATAHEKFVCKPAPKEEVSVESCAFKWSIGVEPSAKYIHMIELIDPHVSSSIWSSRSTSYNVKERIPVHVNVKAVTHESAIPSYGMKNKLLFILRSNVPVSWMVDSEIWKLQFIHQRNSVISSLYNGLLTDMSSAFEDVDHLTGHSYIQWVIQNYGKPLYYSMAREVNQLDIFVGRRKPAKRNSFDDLICFKKYENLNESAYDYGAVDEEDNEYIALTRKELAAYIKNYLILYCSKDTLDIILPYHNLRFDRSKMFMSLSTITCLPQSLEDAFYWHTKVGHCDTEISLDDPNTLINEIVIHKHRRRWGMGNDDDDDDDDEPIKLPIRCTLTDLNKLLLKPNAPKFSYRPYGKSDTALYQDYPIQISLDKGMFIVADLKIFKRVKPYLRARFDSCVLETFDEDPITTVPVLRDGCPLTDMLTWRWKLNENAFTINQKLGLSSYPKDRKDFLDNFHVGYDPKDFKGYLFDDLILEEGVELNFKRLTNTSNITIMKCNVSVCVKSKRHSVPGLNQCARGWRDKCLPPSLSSLINKVAGVNNSKQGVYGSYQLKLGPFIDNKNYTTFNRSKIPDFGACIFPVDEVNGVPCDDRNDDDDDGVKSLDGVGGGSPGSVVMKNTGLLPATTTTATTSTTTTVADAFPIVPDNDYINNEHKCDEGGKIGSAAVVVIAFAAFLIGVLLIGTLWCIQSRTGPRKKKTTPSSRCMSRATHLKCPDSSQGTLTNQACCPTFNNS